MADQVLKLKEIEDIFHSVTCKMLNLDMSKEENQGKVRIAWPTDGAPDWNINEDIVFIRITPEDNRLARQQDILYEQKDLENPYAKKRIGYTRVHRVDWTLYGPNSYDNADEIRFLLFENEYVKTLKAKGLFLITDVTMPVRLPEEYKGKWWDRTNFTASFNELVIRENKVPSIYGTDIEILMNR